MARKSKRIKFSDDEEGTRGAAGHGSETEESDDPEFVNGEVFHYDKPKRKSHRVSALEAIPMRGTKAKPKKNVLSRYLEDNTPISTQLSQEKSTRNKVDAEEVDSDTEEQLSETDRRKSPHKPPSKSIKLKRNMRNLYSSDSEPGPSTEKTKVVQRQKSGSPADSATESDSDYDKPRATLRKMPTNASTDSSTEEEDDVEGQATLQLQIMKEQAIQFMCAFTTAPNADLQLNTAKKFEGRPNFATEDQHDWKGALVIDAKNNIHVTGCINRYLREYQRDGIKFFYERWSETRGGILGDDMGLGKTIQVISFLSAIMQKTGDNRDLKRRYNYVHELQQDEDWRQTLPAANAKWPTCLIIAPTSVVPNWMRELETWGYFEVAEYHGRSKDDVLKEFKYGRLDIVVTSFDTARLKIEELDALPWSCIFVDEAHRIKNPDSQITRAMNRFACPIRFGLTGTAIQNDYAELWTILDWSKPGEVGTIKEWKDGITTPLKVGQSQSASEEQLAIARTLAVRLVQKLLPVFFLRRTKVLISDQMPKKHDQVVFCPMTARQIFAYKNVLEHCGESPARGEVLKYIGVLIKVSNHLALVLPTSTDNIEQVKLSRELTSIAFADRDAPSYGLAVLDEDFCGKWKTLTLLLEAWKRDAESKNKVLLFSRSVKLLKILEFYFKRRDFKSCRLDGSTNPQERMSIIDEFNQDPSVFVFLISTLAGGTGLNLTSANKVVLFDPHWNPAHDLQAIDRAFRIGQIRDVSVYRLLSAGSIEEHIYGRQIYKQQQMAIGYEASMQTRYFKGVQGKKGQEGELFGLRNLFTLNETAVATKYTIEKSNREQLVWALANMPAGKSESTPSSQEAVHHSQPLVNDESDTIGQEEADLQGLAGFLYDEDVKPKAERDAIQEILSSVGVAYSHTNEELLRPSHVEGQVSEKAIKNLQLKVRSGPRRKGASAKAEEKVVAPWPPKRKIHKGPENIAERLNSRRKALVALRYIGNSLEEFDTFSVRFNLRSAEEQGDILRRLDDWTVRNGS